ncbi:MAG: guanylate kinase [Candidatus Omnitrophica bacterium]|nr:guanylate kinase [Candidatus Omnitrophota bacterium]
MNKKGRLFVVSAPSGAGKTTLCEKLVRTDTDIMRSVSMTTRLIRPGEKNGRDYFFISAEEFKKKIKNDEFLEYAKVFGNYYGTPREYVEESLNKNKDVLLAIDVQGAMKIRKKMRKRCTLVFILAPDIQELKRRLLKRQTESKTQIMMRLEVARHELSYLKYYDYKIINDNIKTAFKKLQAIVVAARCEIN